MPSRSIQDPTLYLPMPFAGDSYRLHQGLWQSRTLYCGIPESKSHITHQVVVQQRSWTHGCLYLNRMSALHNG